MTEEEKEHYVRVRVNNKVECAEVRQGAWD